MSEGKEEMLQEGKYSKVRHRGELRRCEIRDSGGVETAGEKKPKNLSPLLREADKNPPPHSARTSSKVVLECGLLCYVISQRG